ncbi:MAG TPA: hypothetical protein DCP47_01405 [Phycisphaerales bacterium]|nr:hypothetical protein [Phycisphaerales bacterium]
MRIIKRLLLRIFKPQVLCVQEGHKPVDYVCEVLTNEGADGICVGFKEVWCKRCGQWLEVKEKHTLRGLLSMSYNGNEMAVYGRFIEYCWKK